MDGVFQQIKEVVVFGAQVDIARLCPEGVSGNGHSLNKGEGVSFQDIPVLEGAHLPLVRIADDVFLIARRLSGPLPFKAAGKAGPTPPAQSRGFYFVGDRFRGHLAPDFLQGFKAVSFQKGGNLPGVNHPAIF